MKRRPTKGGVGGVCLYVFGFGGGFLRLGLARGNPAGAGFARNQPTRADEKAVGHQVGIFIKSLHGKFVRATELLNRIGTGLIEPGL